MSHAMKPYIIIMYACMLCGCQSATETAYGRFFRQTSPLHSYATVEWPKLCRKYWFPDMNYWEEQIEAKLNDSLFPREMAVSYWVAMQSAREFVHRQGMPLRAQARIEVIEQLDLLEAAFDTVFMRCISEPYYMRLLPDIYDEVIPGRLDTLYETMRRNSPTDNNNAK